MLFPLEDQTLMCAADTSEAQNRGYHPALQADQIVVHLLRRILLAKQPSFGVAGIFVPQSTKESAKAPFATNPSPLNSYSVLK